MKFLWGLHKSFYILYFLKMDIHFLLDLIKHSILNYIIREKSNQKKFIYMRYEYL